MDATESPCALELSRSSRLVRVRIGLSGKINRARGPQGVQGPEGPMPELMFFTRGTSSSRTVEFTDYEWHELYRFTKNTVVEVKLHAIYNIKCNVEPLGAPIEIRMTVDGVPGSGGPLDGWKFYPQLDEACTGMYSYTTYTDGELELVLEVRGKPSDVTSVIVSYPVIHVIGVPK